MAWFKDYFARRREANIRRKAEEAENLEMQRYATEIATEVQNEVDRILRFRGGLTELNQLTHEAYEIIPTGTTENTVKISNLTYKSWETDFSVVNMDKVSEYKKLLDQGWVALVCYDKREHEGLPVRRQKLSSTNL